MNLFSFIKGRVSIIDVISEYATLKRAGHYLKGTCPFHHEKTASFTVSPHKDIFYCFGCHTGGDVIAFIAKAEQCTQMEAAKYIAERYNIELPEELLKQHPDSSSQTIDEKKRYWKLCDLVALWCYQQLKMHKEAQSYLGNRMINAEIIDRFKLGYFPQSPHAIKDLIDLIRKHHYLAQDLLATNAVAESKGLFYSPLADRIIYPIYDLQGRCCGFGGRIFKQHDERPKYYNCKESAFFIKGSLLFGFDAAKKAIQEQNCAFLVEGYMDCISMAQHGFANTVATLGTACTQEQLKILSRYAQQVHVLYDGDQAGKKAMLRLTELCWQVNLELRIIELPTGEDPDSFLKKGGDLGHLMNESQDIFQFFIATLGKGYAQKGLQEKLETLRELLEVIIKIDDPLKKDILLQGVAKTCDIPFSVLIKECERATGQNPPDKRFFSSQTTKAEATINLFEEVPLLEKKLFSVMINNMNLVKNEDIDYLIEYATPPVRDLLKKLQLLKLEHEQLDFSFFFEALNAEEKVLMSQLLVACYEYEGPENLDYLLTQFQKKNWKSFVTDTKIKLNRAKQEENTQAIEKILSRFQELKQKLVSRGLI